MGINDGGRVMLPRKKMALWQENRKRKKKNQGVELISGLSGWLCQGGYWKLGWKREC